MTTELPDLKMRGLVNFPVSVTGRTAIAIEKTSGRYYLDLDVSGLVHNTNISADQVDESWMLIWNETTDAYELVPYALAATSGVASIDGKTGALDIGDGLKFTGDTLEADIASQDEAEEGTENTVVTSPLRVKQLIRVIDNCVSVTDFGGLPATSNIDTDPDAAAGINAALAYAESRNFNLHFPNGVYPLDSRINTPGRIIKLSGEQGGNQPTILYKRFVETDPHLGVISLGAWGAHLHDLQFAAKAGSSGGSAISAILPNNAANIGILRLDRIYVSGGDAFNHDLYIDGTNNVAPAGPSYRSVFVNDCHFFGAASSNIYLRGVQHFFGTNWFVATTGGSVSSGQIMVIDGTVAAYSDDIHIHSSFFAGNVTLSQLSRASIISPITGLLNIESTCDDVSALEALGGTIYLGTNCYVIKDNSIVEADFNSNGSWITYGDGRIEQWGSVTSTSGVATVTFPVSFPVEAQSVLVNPTSTPAANSIILAQAHSITTTGCTLRAMNVLVGGASSLSSTNISWRARGI